jgi:hypothetical protein
LGQVPKQWWSVPVASHTAVCCHCGVVVVVKYILYTFLDPCLCFTWTTLIDKICMTDNLHSSSTAPLVHDKFGDV